MKIIGFMGSPHLHGFNRKFIDSALKGAESEGAAIKRYDLIQCNIQYCRGCMKCVYENHELPFGKCPLKDDMASILEEYLQADGYILVSPVYDVNVTALMKTFLERKVALFFKQKGDFGKIPDARVKAHFKKKAALIATGSAGDEFKEVMAVPSFETMEAHFLIEEIDVVDKLYVGGLENITQELLSEKLDEAYTIGIRLVEEIKKAREESSEKIPDCKSKVQ
jgi:multimeric flavodoxin WrbA